MEARRGFAGWRIDGLPPVGRLAGDRLPDGRRVALALAGGRATLTLGDDLAPLGAALAGRAAAAVRRSATGRSAGGRCWR